MKRPKSKYKAGAIEASLWENELDSSSGERVVVLKASVERRYRKSDGTWASTNSYSKADLPQVIFVLQQAYADIIAYDNERAANARGSAHQPDDR